MKNKIISILTIIIMLSVIIYPTLVSYSADEKIIIPNSVEEILSGTYKNQNITEVIFEEPSSLKKIWWSAFYNNKIKSLEIPNSVEEIQDFAFNLNEITDLKLGNSVKMLGQYAFSQNKIKTLNIPDSVEEIRTFAFASNEITDLKLGNSVRVIKDAAFAYNKIKSLEIPDSVKEIEGNAFQNNNLTELTIPSSVNRIGDQSFINNQLKTIVILNPNLIIGEPNLDPERDAFSDNDEDLVIYGYLDSTAQEYAEKYGIRFEEIDESLEKDYETTINGIKYKIDLKEQEATVIEVTDEAIDSDRKLVIPATIEENDKKFMVKTIASESVKQENIQEITLPWCLVTIEENAFLKYKGSIEIPECVYSLDINSFSTHQVKVKISEDNLFYDTSRRFLYNKDHTVLYGFITENSEDFGTIVVDEKTREIKEKAFKYLKYFEKIKINPLVTKIADDAFEGIEDKIEIVGYEDTYVQTYAHEHSIRFFNLGKIDETAFKFGTHNYNFENSDEYFKSYKIGKKFTDLLSPTLYEIYLKDKDEEWGGSCAGIALTNILFNKGYLNEEKWVTSSSEGGFPHNMSLGKTMYDYDSLRGLINFYQEFQIEIEEKSYNRLNIESESLIESVFQGVEKHYENSENENNILYFTYGFEYENTETKEMDYGGHAVVIIGGPQTLDEDFYLSHDEVYKNFKYRIPIYDVNCTDICFVYVAENFENVAMGNDSGLINFKTVAGDDDSSYSDDYEISSIDAYELNEENVFNIEDYLDAGKEIKIENFNKMGYDRKAAATIKDAAGKYAKVKNGKKIEGNLEGKVQIPVSTTVEGVNGTSNDAYMTFSDGDYYSIETDNDTDELNASMYFGDSYMTAKTKAGGKAIFENPKSVTLSNPSGQEYEASLTLNNEFKKLPWFTIIASGTGTTEIKLENVEEGILVTGDNLQDLLIRGNNKEEQVQLDISTDKTQVLIKTSEDGTRMIAYIDTDGDGIYETPLGEATAEPIPEENKEEQTKGVKTGDNIKYFAIAFIIALVILIIIWIIKHFKK